MITKVVYIHNDKPFDVYQKDIDDPEILPNIIDSITFFQDLYIPSIEGEIIITDFGLYDLLPLDYKDKIRIYTINPIYNSEDKTFEIGKDYYTEFRILSAEMMSSEPNILDKDNFKQFVLRIIDDMSFRCYLEKESVRYIDKTVTDIVKDIITPIWFKPSNIKINPNISLDRYNITFPKWTPYQKLNYLSKFTEFSDGTGCVFFNSLPVFYEDRKSEYDFNYTNISSLIKNKEDFTNEEYSLTSDVNRVYNVLLEEDRNRFSSLNSGKFINNTKMEDTNNRSVLNRKYKSSELYNDIRYEHIRPKSVLGLNYEYNHIMKSVFGDYTIFCTVSGDYKRKIGTVIDFKFPSSFDSLNKKDYYNETYTGKYLIKSMEHVFVKDENQRWVYNQKIGLITDEYKGLDK